MKSIALTAALLLGSCAIAAIAFAQTRVETPVHSDKSVTLTLETDKVWIPGEGWRPGEPRLITVEIQNKRDGISTISAQVTFWLRRHASSEKDRKDDRDLYWAPASLMSGKAWELGDKSARELLIKPSETLPRSFSLDELKWRAAISSTWPDQSLHDAVPAGSYEVWAECYYKGATLKSPVVLITIKN